MAMIGIIAQSFKMNTEMQPKDEEFTSILCICPLLSPLQPSLRWATIWAPSFRRTWCAATPCEAHDPASNWTASSRCALSSSPWRKCSGRETRPWRATSASAMRTSCLGPSPGSCDPLSTDRPAALWIHSIIPCSGHDFAEVLFLSHKCPNLLVCIQHISQYTVFHS